MSSSNWAPARALAALLALSGARSERVVGDFVIALADGPNAGVELYATRANGAPLRPPPAAAAAYRVVAPHPRDLCSPPAALDGSLAGALVIAPRGVCSFETKLRNAAAGRAALLVVYGTIGAAYANVSSSYALADPCAVDCARGSFGARAAAGALAQTAQRADGFHAQCASRCASGVCAAAGVLESDAPVAAGDELEVCCLTDERMVMNLGGASTGLDGAPDVPAVFALRADGERLVAAAAAGARAHAHERAAMSVDPSVLVIWALGVSAATLAAWLATARERHAASLVGPDGTRGKPGGWTGRARSQAPAAAPDDGEETLELTATHALAFVFVASVSLVAMFVLLQVRRSAQHPARARSERLRASPSRDAPAPPRAPSARRVPARSWACSG